MDQEEGEFLSMDAGMLQLLVFTVEPAVCFGGHVECCVFQLLVHGG